MSEEHKVELIPTDPNPPRPLGRRGVNHDPRNFAFRALAAPSVPEGPPRTTPWYRREIYDQQATSSCTIHAEYGGLRTFSNLSSTSWWFQELDTYGERVATYEESKRYDPWPGEDYEGTSSDAPCKLLKARGRIERYQWFFSPEEVDFWLEHHGQVTVGTNWYYSMFYPNRSGTIRIVDSQGNAGGHEWNLIYHDVKNRRKRGITSWGRTFGQYGRFWISDEDFARLMAEDGDAHFSKAQRYVKPVVAAA